MKCSRCEFENPPGMKFCGECGERLQNVCPACKALNPPNHKFCGECGQRLSTVAPREPEPAAQPLSPAPEAYTPKHLAQRILSSREALEGERKRDASVCTPLARATT